MNQELIKRILSSIVLIPVALFFIIKGAFLFIFFISICFCIIAYEWHMMRKKKPYYLLGFLFLIFSFVTIYELRFANYSIGNDYIWVLIITIICVATDVGGYIFGKIFKGPKLTKISPNKTYSGMIGSFILSIIAGSLYTQYQSTFTFFEISLYRSKIFVFLISEQFSLNVNPSIKTLVFFFIFKLFKAIFPICL